MESTRKRGGILMELQSLISQSCAPGKSVNGLENLHKQILKWHYNAKNISIDYHRKRVKMDLIVQEENSPDVGGNGQINTIPANFYFKDICDFLISCLPDNVHNLKFYKELIKSVPVIEKEEVVL